MKKTILLGLRLPIIILFAANLFGQSANSKSGTDSVLIIDDIQVLGNRTTKEYVIFREMQMKRGDTLRQESIDRDRNNIYNLGLFNKVDIEYAANQNHASVYVIVTERLYFLPYPILGMKYRDPSKLYYGAGFIQQNFMGRNEKLYTNVCFGYDRWISIGYSNPKVTDGDDIFVGGNVTIQKIHNLSTSQGEYENSNIFFNSTLGKRFGMYQTLYASLGYEIWQVNDPQLNRTLSPSGRDAFISGSIQYRYDTRNNREYTTDGYLVSLSALKCGFGESDMKIFALYYDLRKFIGFDNGCSFGMRSLGAFWGGGKIPPYKHVFFGYDERLRGYFYNVFEAENRVSASLELRLPILLPRYLELSFINYPQFQKLRYGLYFGIFVDAGKLWSYNQVISEQPWYSGYGAGFQFLLPYGFTIRTEVAINNAGKTQGIIDFDTSF